MKNKEESVDKAKVEATFEKLQANPAILNSVLSALNDLFEKLSLNLNDQEKLLVLKGIFESLEEPKSTARGIPQDLNCVVKLISYQCKGCSYPG